MRATLFVSEGGKGRRDRASPLARFVATMGRLSDSDGSAVFWRDCDEIGASCFYPASVPLYVYAQLPGRPAGPAAMGVFVLGCCLGSYA